MKNWKSRAAVLGMTSAMFVMAFACSSSSSTGSNSAALCSSTPACPNDSKPDVAKCQAALDDPNCGSKNSALGSCVAAHNHCGADGKSDTTGLSACGTEFSEALSCASAHPPGDSGGGG